MENLKQNFLWSSQCIQPTKIKFTYLSFPASYEFSLSESVCPHSVDKSVKIPRIKSIFCVCSIQSYRSPSDGMNNAFSGQAGTKNDSDTKNFGFTTMYFTSHKNKHFSFTGSPSNTLIPQSLAIRQQTKNLIFNEQGTGSSYREAHPKHVTKIQK